MLHVKGHYRQENSSAMGNADSDEASVFRGQAPFRCGHCHQVSNWKHVIQVLLTTLSCVLTPFVTLACSIRGKILILIAKNKNNFVCITMNVIVVHNVLDNCLIVKRQGTKDSMMLILIYIAGENI